MKVVPEEVGMELDGARSATDGVVGRTVEAVLGVGVDLTRIWPWSASMTDLAKDRPIPTLVALEPLAL